MGKGWTGKGEKEFELHTQLDTGWLDTSGASIESGKSKSTLKQPLRVAGHGP